LPGQGSRVDSLNHLAVATASSSSYKCDPNSTFRKRTQTRSARELRAQAALNRLLPAKEETHRQIDISKAIASTVIVTGEVKPESQTSSPCYTVDESSSDGAKTASEDSDLDEGLVVDLDNGSNERSTVKADISRHLGFPTSLSPSSGTGSQTTLASKETENQRRERARQYHQHEQKQGGINKTTQEEWEDFCVLASRTAGRRSVKNDRTPARYGNKEEPIEVLSSSDDDARPTRVFAQPPPRAEDGSKHPPLHS
jgi:hypothetical protein